MCMHEPFTPATSPPQSSREGGTTRPRCRIKGQACSQKATGCQRGRQSSGDVGVRRLLCSGGSDTESKHRWIQDWEEFLFRSPGLSLLLSTPICCVRWNLGSFWGIGRQSGRQVGSRGYLPGPHLSHPPQQLPEIVVHLPCEVRVLFQGHPLEDILALACHIPSFGIVSDVGLGKPVQYLFTQTERLQRHCEPRCGDPLYMQHIRRHAGELLKEKMIISPIHKIATFLSPCFKTLKMLSPDESLAVHAETRRLTTALIPALQAQSAQSTSQAADGTSAAQREEAEEHLLKRRRMFLEWEDTPDLIEPDEVQRYVQSHFSLEECSDDVLGFWRAQS